MNETTDLVRIIDSDALALGDIILERGEDKGAAVTAAVTGGEFSHALIYVGGDDVVEAMPGGVRSLSLHRLPVTSDSKLKLLRVNSEHAGVAAKAATNARGEAFKDYDMRGALASQSTPRSSPLPTALFCSQLIAKSYADAGLELAPGQIVSSVSPNHLDRSPVLKAHPLPLKPAPIPLLPLLKSALADRSAAYKTSTMAIEKEIAREAYKGAMALIAGTGFSFDPKYAPGNLHELLGALNRLPEPVRALAADHLYDALDRDGYFTLGLAMLHQILHSDSEPAPVSYDDAHARNLSNARTCVERCREFDHQLWRRLAAMYGFMADGMVALAERAATRKPPS